MVVCMGIQFDKIEPGMKLADIHCYKAGNTNVSVEGLWWVDIVSVDPVKRTAVVRWNDNRPETWTERRLKRLYTETSPKVLRYKAGNYKGAWLMER